MLKFIPFALPDIGSDEINEVIDALKSGWITTGPKVKQFESDFQDFIGGGVEAIAVNSATAGLHLALEALGVTEGDEVIIPSLTFTATAEVVRYLGANVKIVDVNPATLNIDVKEIRAAISSKTKVIMPVHYAGLSCNMDEILSLAKEFDLKVVEDAAHALPATYKGDMIGSLESDITVFSFYANKTMTTGEGGMVVTRNSDLAKRMKIMRLHGIDRDAFDRFQSKKPTWYYEVVAPGFKYNMTDIAAAMGIHQLKRLPGFLKRRQYLAKRYFDALLDLPITLPSDGMDGDFHSWHLFIIRLQDNTSMSRDELIQFLSDQGIGTSVHYVPLHHLQRPYLI
jgi:dTDP-4-amino-4,6-dideoxygalactose transaminase